MINRNDLDISIIVVTHDRDQILNQTLSYFSHLDRTGINAEFIIVDNKSKDHTRDVVDSFKRSMPIRYLFHRKADLNGARNYAIVQPGLGKIVAFTDDDIVPRKDWLIAMVSMSMRKPRYSVFGGQIYIIWPYVKQPQWVRQRPIRNFAFGEHHYSPNECPYDGDSGNFPYDGNFWVRRELLDGNNKFDESPGRHHSNRILDTETTFFQRLWDKGHKFMYCPWSVVGHRITPEQLSLLYLIKRAYCNGRGIAHIQPLCRQLLLDNHPAFWRFIRVGAISKLAVSLTASMFPLALHKPDKTIHAMRWIGYNVEELNIIKGR